jgi:hypothetical protein
MKILSAVKTLQGLVIHDLHCLETQKDVAQAVLGSGEPFSAIELLH